MHAIPLQRFGGSVQYGNGTIRAQPDLVSGYNSVAVLPCANAHVTFIARTLVAAHRRTEPLRSRHPFSEYLLIPVVRFPHCAHRRSAPPATQVVCEAMPLRTRLTELLKIDHPIVVGGLTGVGTIELAAAVSNAGGLGIFTAHNAGSPEGARAAIRKLQTLTSKPFGVNLTILPTIGPPPPYEEYAQVFIDEGVKVVETAGSDPSQWVKMFKPHGIVMIHKCVAIRHALKAERLGVDIISLDGFECAGHPGVKLGALFIYRYISCESC